MNGYFNLHRKFLKNNIFRFDPNAWRLFLVIMALVDYETGEWSGGIYQLAEWAVLNKNTTYDALVRLQREGMITKSSNNKYSVIRICNWLPYQTVGQKRDNNQTITRQEPDNTLIINNNKEVISNTKPETDKLIREVYDFFIATFKRNPNLYKLSRARKVKIGVRLKDAGIDMIKLAITNTSNSKFHMGDGERGWKADLDYILRSYEKLESLANMEGKKESDMQVLLRKQSEKTNG